MTIFDLYFSKRWSFLFPDTCLTSRGVSESYFSNRSQDFLYRISPGLFASLRNLCFRVLRDATQLWYKFRNSHSILVVAFSSFVGMVVFLRLFVWFLDEKSFQMLVRAAARARRRTPWSALEAGQKCRPVEGHWSPWFKLQHFLQQRSNHLLVAPPLKFLQSLVVPWSEGRSREILSSSGHFSHADFLTSCFASRLISFLSWHPWSLALD